MTNLLGVHTLVWSGRWDEDGARHANSSAAEAGFDLIEVPVLDPYGIDTAMTPRLLENDGDDHARQAREFIASRLPR